MINGIFEIEMLLCFAAAWPFNIVRSWRARTAVGTSPWFMIVIEIGYLCGMANKIVNNDVNYVFAFYVFDFILVLIGLFIFGRNKAIDKAKGRTKNN